MNLTFLSSQSKTVAGFQWKMWTKLEENWWYVTNKCVARRNVVDTTDIGQQLDFCGSWSTVHYVSKLYMQNVVALIIHLVMEYHRCNYK